VILDWKGGGDEAAYERALKWLPDVLHEDPVEPYPAAIGAALAVDAAVTEPTSLDRLAPAAVNLKPARMGSLLDVVRTAVRCARRDVAVYVGGMFEIGVGRRQLCDLASVLCPDAPNDLAPIPLAETATTP
jgi:O-succinylbenzoate synthase